MGPDNPVNSYYRENIQLESSTNGDTLEIPQACATNFSKSEDNKFGNFTSQLIVQEEQRLNSLKTRKITSIIYPKQNGCPTSFVNDKPDAFVNPSACFSKGKQLSLLDSPSYDLEINSFSPQDENEPRPINIERVCFSSSSMATNPQLATEINRNSGLNCKGPRQATNFDMETENLKATLEGIKNHSLNNLKCFQRQRMARLNGLKTVSIDARDLNDDLDGHTGTKIPKTKTLADNKANHTKIHYPTVQAMKSGNYCFSVSRQEKHSANRKQKLLDEEPSPEKLKLQPNKRFCIAQTPEKKVVRSKLWCTKLPLHEPSTSQQINTKMLLKTVQRDINKNIKTKMKQHPNKQRLSFSDQNNNEMMKTVQDSNLGDASSSDKQYARVSTFQPIRGSLLNSVEINNVEQVCMEQPYTNPSQSYWACAEHEYRNCTACPTDQGFGRTTQASFDRHINCGVAHVLGHTGVSTNSTINSWNRGKCACLIQNPQQTSSDNQFRAYSS